ncbi:hypothetical protein DFH11DRAFT_1606216 [Phellopilus nigrolimitatus]|nr:hypothetical protein DFH11DRAFT_1606216 [Phellopilus nigrolimitatus]
MMMTTTLSRCSAFAEVRIIYAMQGCSTANTQKMISGRKLKCDGRSICSNCLRRSLACVYTPV